MKKALTLIFLILIPSISFSYTYDWLKFGIPQQKGAYGLAFDYTSGVLTIKCQNGIKRPDTCSTSNYGIVVMDSTSYGQSAVIRVTQSYTLSDDDYSGTSNLTNQGFGITETAHWANDKPFYIYWANPNDGASDGTDGNPAPFIAAVPHLTATPSSTMNIGDTAANSATDAQASIIMIDDITNTNYDNVPAMLVGAIRMQWSTTTDDWTIQALNSSDGVGNYHEGTLFTMPTGQMGAVAGSYLKATSTGTNPPTWATSTYEFYTIKTTGEVKVQYLTDLSGNCTNGISSTQLGLAVPYYPTSISQSITSCGYYKATSESDAAGNALCQYLYNDNIIYLYGSDANPINANTFSNSGDDFSLTINYDIL